MARALYFQANDGTSGIELWELKADGTVVRVADISPGTASSNPAGLTAFDGELYFSATDGTSGTELWKLKADGSAVRAADILIGPGSSNPSGFTAFNNE